MKDNKIALYNSYKALGIVLEEVLMRRLCSKKVSQLLCWGFYWSLTFCLSSSSARADWPNLIQQPYKRRNRVILVPASSDQDSLILFCPEITSCFHLGIWDFTE